MVEPLDGLRKVPALRSTAAGWRFLALLAIIGGAILIARFTPVGDYVSREGAVAFLEVVREARWAPALFVAFYATAAALATPGSALAMVGGAVFGIWPGFGLNMLGATIGAVLAFLLSRWLGRDFVAARMKGRAETLGRRLGEAGFRTILMLRLVPFVPYNALNYAAALTGIRVREYALATAIGIIPSAFVYTYFADALVAGSIADQRGALVHAVIAGLLITALALLPAALRRQARNRAIRRRTSRSISEKNRRSVE